MPNTITPWDEHKRLYPAQYSHPLVGKRVTVAKLAGVHTVVRVISDPRFGQLVCLDSLSDTTAYAIAAVTVIS